LNIGRRHHYRRIHRRNVESRAANVRAARSRRTLTAKAPAGEGRVLFAESYFWTDMVVTASKTKASPTVTNNGRKNRRNPI
jgi:hypothetical protein